MATRPVNLTGRDGSQISAAQANRIYSDQTRKLMGFARTAIPELKAFASPEYWIYNVGPETCIVEGLKALRPQAPLALPACPQGAEHSEGIPIMEQYVEEFLGLNNKTELAWYNGFEIADAVLRTGAGMPPSSSLLKRGFFYSRNNPPLPEEIAAAKARLVGTYTQLAQTADANFAKNDLKEINEEPRRAAKYLGMKSDWNKKYVPTVECPNCGEPVSATMGIHNGAGGCGAIVNEERARQLFPMMFMEPEAPKQVETEQKHKK